MVPEKQGSLWGGTLLVAGTAIGGGMLALPVLTGMGGFVPSIAIYVSCWFFMVCAGLLFLEVSLACEPNANILSMAEKTLGVFGRWYSWLLYLFFFYCLTVAYMVGCGNLLLGFLGWQQPALAGPLLFTALFAPFVVVGTRLVSAVNGLMMVALFALYGVLVLLGLPYIDTALLQRREWHYAALSLPVAFAAFGFQGVIPTLVNYLGRDQQRCRSAIVVGSTIPLAVYLLWQTLILGIVPVEGAGGLAEALAQGQDAVQPLRHFVSNPYLLLIGNIFAFLALVTSFFGVTLGLTDFLADGLRLSNKGLPRLFISLMVFVPPLLITLWRPDLFLTALNMAGGFGAALLLGLLPVMMAWAGRYRGAYASPYTLSGGRALLLAMVLFIALELCLELWFMLGG